MRRRPFVLTVLCIAVFAFLIGLLGQAWAASAPRLSAISPSAIPVPVVTPTPAAPPTVKLPPPPVPPPQVTAVTSAYAAGAPRVSRLAVAMLDLESGRLYSAGDIDSYYPSASLVKAFIAARLLVEGQAADPGVQDLMWRMIVCSHDDAASALYGRVGGDSLVSWVSQRYGIGGLAPPRMPGWWGTTRVTARAMVEFYARAAADPAVATWLRDAMANTQPYGCDRFYQHFGIPSAAAAWQVKQGWVCCWAGRASMHSTGYVDGYAVALMAEGPTGFYGDYGAQTLTIVARTLLPGGVVPASK
jgi:hypothetical protein